MATAETTALPEAERREAQPSGLARGVSLGVGLALGALALIWGILIWRLRLHWGGESYYNFGFAVPILTLFLIYRRFQWLPQLRPPARPSLLLIGASVLAVLFIFPALLSEVNPFWRVPILMQGALAFLVTGCVVWAIGGWPLFRHLIFPAIFLATMIPWPYRIEVDVIQAFTAEVVRITELSLRLLGYPAVQAGNLILIGDTQVGVDEACSGIRSLQALIMSGLFLGELFYLRIWARLALLVASVAVVYVLNAARSITLSLITVEGGAEAYDAWHDRVGIIVFVLSIAILFLLADFFSRRYADEPEKTPLAARFRLPKKSSAVLLGAALVSILSVEGWFRYHEMQEDGRPMWTVDWPATDEANFRQREIPERVASLLGYDFGDRGWFFTPDLQEVDIYFYGYDGSNPMASVSSYGHSPEICMSSIGASMLREHDSTYFSVGDISIPFRHFTFRLPPRAGGGVIDVFWCVWEKRNMGIDSEILQSLNWKAQLAQVRAGRRDYARQVLLGSVVGVDNRREARQLFLKKLDQIVELGEVPPLGKS